MKTRISLRAAARPACCLAGALIAATTVWGQQSSTAAPATNAAAPAASSSTTSEEIVTLSPFEVTNEGDMGYYASSTLSGTRMNTRIRDLGASISVVTLQQLQDTASVDINDVFMYEANTEGTHTYTAYGLDRGSISTTTVQMNPTVANRVRGLGSPDRAVDYFISLDRIPFDAYNVDRITLNRGPNSVLFGLGTAAGLVNTTLAKADIGKDTNRVELRYGSFDDIRGVLNFNRTLIDDKLAVRVAAMYSEEGFEQQPSHDITRRQYATVQYRPFERTRINASYERFSNDYRRPNANTPQDFITRWETAGRPTFNPSTMMVTWNGNEQPIGTAATNSFATQLGILSNAGLGLHPHATRAAFFIENNQVFGRMQRQLGTTIGGSNQVEQLAATNGYTLPSAIFTPPGINRRELLDWDKINVLSGNYGWDKAHMYQANIEQEVIDNLFIDVAFRREDLDTFGLSAQSGNQAAIYVDPNETLLDGTPNPFFLKPYIEVWEPTANENHIVNDAARITAAYEANFKQNEGWTRWLGRHNLMGFAERREIEEVGFRFREAVISTHEGWAPERNPNGTIIDKSTGSNFRTRHNRVYYLGDNARVTHAPGDALFGTPPNAGAEFPDGVIGDPFPTTLRHFIPGTGRDGSTDYGVPGGRPVGEWVDETAISAVILHDTNPATEQTKIDSQAALLQSYLFDDRIVLTYGVRKDERKFRRSLNPIINEQGFRDNLGDRLDDFPTDWDVISGKTYSKGVVIHPLERWRFVPEYLQGFSFHYNESDTFTPAATQQDLFLNVLPVPQGKGKDWGVSYTTPDSTFVVRLNWYESAEANSRVNSSLVAGRARRVENEGGWGLVDMIEREIELREGLEANTLDAFATNNPATAPYLNEISEKSGLPIEWLQSNIQYHDTRTVSSEGMELSIDYNPNRNWNFKLTAGQQEAVNSEVNPNTQRWLFGDGSFESPEAGTRLARWQAATFSSPASDQTRVVGEQVSWWDTEWAGMPTWGRTPRAWYTGVVESLLRQDIRLQGLSNPQVREWRWAAISNYRFTEGRFKGLGLGGSVRWEDKGAIGYMGMVNPASGVMEFYDVDNPIYDDSKYFFDFWASYNMRLWDDRINMRIQLNCRNAFEEGGLQVFAANPDGTPAGFRILQPRTWYLTTAFEF